MKPLILFIFVFFPLISEAQISENFNDGNYTENPRWFGDTNRFIVNADLQLQLFDSTYGKAFLVTSSAFTKNQEWRFRVTAKYSPSSRNFVRIYITSNQPDLNGKLQGYFLQLGEKGKGDALELFRQDSNTITSICRSESALIAAPYDLNIKVICKGKHWMIYSSEGTNENYNLEAAGNDLLTDLSKGKFFGILCEYTKSNSHKSYFDNIYINPWHKDTIPPKLDSLWVISDSSLMLFYNEPIVLNNKTSFKLIPGNQEPFSTCLQEDGKAVRLDFSTSFSSKTNYQILWNHITDKEGNFSSGEYKFLFYKAQHNDVSINEIMADPSPSRKLPEVEYLELYNNTDYPINLGKWELSWGKNKGIFPNYLLSPKSYILITNKKVIDSLLPFGDVIGFSKFSLLNKGNIISLKNRKQRVISSVIYSDKWYSSDKKSGGWSLEQINPENICSGDKNWTSAIDDSGGTPGRKNSVFDEDLFVPQIDSAKVLGSDSLVVYFNQIMDSVSVSDKQSWYIQPSESHPQKIYHDSRNLKKYFLIFSNSFESGKQYRLYWNGQIKNCNNLALTKNNGYLFGRIETPVFSDIIFNEILFHPRSGGAEYIELYNHANKIIDLKRINIAVIKNTFENIDTIRYQVSKNEKLIYPGTYMVLSRDPKKVMEQYLTPGINSFLSLGSFPLLSDKSGRLILLTNKNVLIDTLNYNDNMHNPLLYRTDGVSLEKIRFVCSENTEKCWFSASETAGYGTPGYQNSQYETDEIHESNWSCTPEIFSPDGDGYEDVVQISYTMDKADYIISIDIYNTSGNLITHLIQNKIIGISGNFEWNGKNSFGSKLSPGIYIIFIHVTDLNGRIITIKKSVVINYN